MSNSVFTTRRITVATLGALLALSVVACGTPSAEQAKKSVGEGTAGAPVLAGTITPFASLTLPSKNGGLTSGGESETSRLPRIHLTIASPESQIHRSGETRQGYPAECKRPGNDRPLGLPLSVTDVAAGGTGESCVQSRGNDPLSQELTYTLPGTTQLLWIYTRVTPLLSEDDQLQCAIIEPSTWKPAKKTQYGCDLRWMQQDNHLNPLPRVRVTQKPTVVVTDPTQAQKLLAKYCSSGEPECSYHATREEVVQETKSKWTVINVYNNCGPDKHESATHKFSGSRTVGMGSSLGVTSSLVFNIPEVLKIVVSSKYSHGWSTSETVKFGVASPVPWGYADIIYAQPSYLEIDGSFTIKANEGTYVLTGTNFRLPLKDGWTDADGRSYATAETHTRGAKITCPAAPFTGSTGTKMLDGSDAPTADTLKP